MKNTIVVNVHGDGKFVSVYVNSEYMAEFKAWLETDAKVKEIRDGTTGKSFAIIPNIDQRDSDASLRDYFKNCWNEFLNHNDEQVNSTYYNYQDLTKMVTTVDSKLVRMVNTRHNVMRSYVDRRLDEQRVFKEPFLILSIIAVVIAIIALAVAIAL